MKRLILPALFALASGLVLAQSAKDFVGTWKSDPGTPTMTRKLALEGNVIVMTEIQPGRNGGPDVTVIRKYPTDGSTVSMDTGIFKGATATGKMEGNVLTVDTVMPTGQKFHDVWTMAADGQHYTNEMVISGGRGGRGGRGGGQGGRQGRAGARKGGNGRAGRGGPIKFGFTKEK